MSLPAAGRLRRAAAAVAVVAATCLTAAACSSGTSAADAGPGPSASAGQGADVETLYGTVHVPANPQRVVALDFPEATALADLGITPVGIGSYIPALPAYTTFFQGVPDVTDDSGQPVLEKVAAARPDLIVMDSFQADVEKNRPLYQKLSAIAPTVVLLWTQAAGSWQEDAAGTAQAVGKSAELDALKARYEQHAADIKKQYADVLASHTVDLVSGDDKSWFLYGPTSSHGRVLAAAGARFGAAAGQKDGFVQESTEKYGLLDTSDVIIVDAADATAAKPVTDSPVFAHLPAAQDGDVFVTPYFFPSSYQIADALLDDFAAALQKAK